MTTETKADRKKRLARERKRRQRKGNHQRREALGARVISFESYAETREALERMRQRHDFSCNGEAITHLIHAADELAKRDMSRYGDLFGVTCHVSEK
ncbi:MAG TPA: hypothetical protein VNV36_06125 [Pseudomonas sp.]|uniref:hypothetical protein n=1 Tax=Pseudomonas sp. TaxID=306 RepID=UPI002CADBBFF|nr:hypothetical protein [Pseudomonas sp.]HWH86332.1 hypothetical protein [Pseudomonas sp.]